MCFKKELKGDAYKDIARFFYNNAIAFNVARREEFCVMLQSSAKYVLRFQPPSYHDIRIKYLKQEVQTTNDAFAVHHCFPLSTMVVPWQMFVVVFGLTAMVISTDIVGFSTIICYDGTTKWPIRRDFGDRA